MQALDAISMANPLNSISQHRKAIPMERLTSTKNLDTSLLRPDSSYLKHLGRDIWLMDNHRWAFYVWEKYHAESTTLRRFNLIHADYHWDNGDDFLERPDLAALLPGASLKELWNWTTQNQKPIIYDSFIAPTVRRETLAVIHWLCKQAGTPDGFSEEFLREFNCSQKFYSNSNELKQTSIADPLIFDLCLDLFNRNEKMMWAGDLWPENEIKEFLDDCSALIQRAIAVTVSLSFGCSGTEDDTRRLAAIVIPKLNSFRK